jgi:2-polyprenyl-6-methoxyphenol hydroxylase-like FAD-dependent oxidoreductase
MTDFDDKGAGTRAVVLGGSIAGLFTARVLAEVYQEVLIVDRDRLVGVEGHRRGRPQGRHINAMLCKGRLVMEELLPGITDELIADSCPSGDMCDNVRWYFNGKRAVRRDVGLLALPATAPLMERHIRERVGALPRVSFAERREVLALTTTADRTRVTGVRLRNLVDETDETIAAALVVDATGRGSRVPVWLEELGYPKVREERIKIGLGYTTQHYRLTADPYGTDLAIIPVASPELPRGAIFTKTDHGHVELTAYGILDDHPPTDQAGFYEFVKTLGCDGDIYRALQHAEPIDEPVAYRYPTTQRRYYEELDRFPEGLLLTGDAITSFNPVYGQGMTVAALAAQVMRKYLSPGRSPQARRFFADLAKNVIDPPWEMTNTVDLSFAGVQGRRTFKVKMGQAYLKLVQTATTRDSKVTAAYMRTAGMVDRPEALMRPQMIARVLKSSWRGPANPGPRPVAVARERAAQGQGG